MRVRSWNGKCSLQHKKRDDEQERVTAGVREDVPDDDEGEGEIVLVAKVEMQQLESGS